MTIAEALSDIKKFDSEPAFRYIYDSSYERIFRTAYYYVKDDDDAREVAIDVLAGIWNNRKTMIVPRDFFAYCFVATKNVALNYIKSRSRHLHDDIDGDILSDARTPEEDVVDEELFAQYEKTLYGLPERCRRVFIMVKEDGMTYAQVASELNISTKTVDAQIQKATKEIRSAIENYLGRASNSVQMYMSLLF